MTRRETLAFLEGFKQSTIAMFADDKTNSSCPRSRRISEPRRLDLSSYVEISGTLSFMIHDCACSAQCPPSTSAAECREKQITSQKQAWSLIYAVLIGFIDGFGEPFQI